MKEQIAIPDRLFPSLPIQYLVTFVAVLIWSLNSYNFQYSVEAILTIMLIFFFTWRMHEPPILFFGLFLQWIQVTIKVFYANWVHEDFSRIHRFTDHIIQAYHSSLAGLLFIAIGYFLAIRYLKMPPQNTQIWDKITSWNSKHLIIIYVVIFLGGNLLLSFSGGLRQLVTAVLVFKWSLFFLLYYILFHQKKNQKLFVILFIIEVLSGVTGFFSTYKNVFLITIIAFFTFNYFISNARYISILTLCAGLFLFLTVWQSIKSEYRNYLNDDSGAQVVTISRQDAFTELINLVKGFRFSDMGTGIDILVNRTSYIDIYSAVIANVPANIPFEGGNLWLSASLRAFQPRILFPEKGIADDSEKSIQYTGLHFSGSESNTSISMGYMAETYIDFGLKGMQLFLFFFGIAIGFVYYLVMTKSHSPVWGTVFIIPLFFLLNSYEMALDKMVPAIFLYVIAWWLINKYLATKAEAYFTV